MRSSRSYDSLDLHSFRYNIAQEAWVADLAQRSLVQCPAGGGGGFRSPARDETASSCGRAPSLKRWWTSTKRSVKRHMTCWAAWEEGRKAASLSPGRASTARSTSSACTDHQSPARVGYCSSLGAEERDRLISEAVCYCRSQWVGNHERDAHACTT